MVRYLSASGLALVIVAVLFWTMNSMIQDSGTPQSLSDHKAGAYVLLPPQQQLQVQRHSGPEIPKRPDEPLRPPQWQAPEALQIHPQQQDLSIAFELPELSVPITLVGIDRPAPPGLASAMASLRGLSTELIPLVRPAPQYPSQAARARISGWVKLRITVNPNGSVQEARVMESEPRGMFEEAAVTSARRSKFHPRIENGTAVESSGEYTIKFQLGDGA